MRGGTSSEELLRTDHKLLSALLGGQGCGGARNERANVCSGGGSSFSFCFSLSTSVLISNK